MKYAELMMLNPISTHTTNTTKSLKDPIDSKQVAHYSAIVETGLKVIEAILKEKEVARQLPILADRGMLEVNKITTNAVKYIGKYHDGIADGMSPQEASLNAFVNTGLDFAVSWIRGKALGTIMPGSLARTVLTEFGPTLGKSLEAYVRDYQNPYSPIENRILYDSYQARLVEAKLLAVILRAPKLGTDLLKSSIVSELKQLSHAEAIEVTRQFNEMKTYEDSLQLAKNTTAKVISFEKGQLFKEGQNVEAEARALRLKIAKKYSEMVIALQADPAERARIDAQAKILLTTGGASFNTTGVVSQSDFGIIQDPVASNLDPFLLDLTMNTASGNFDIAASLLPQKPADTPMSAQLTAASDLKPMTKLNIYPKPEDIHSISPPAPNHYEQRLPSPPSLLSELYLRQKTATPHPINTTSEIDRYVGESLPNTILLAIASNDYSFVPPALRPDMQEEAHELSRYLTLCQKKAKTGLTEYKELRKIQYEIDQRAEKIINLFFGFSGPSGNLAYGDMHNDPEVLRLKTEIADCEKVRSLAKINYTIMAESNSSILGETHLCAA